MKIGIFGGTFNPVHLAHVQIAKACFDALYLDKLLVIPTFIPPHKDVGHLAKASERMAMCELAIRDYPRFEVCDYEILEKDKSYTYRTLEYLHGKYPGSEFFLLMGGDMFLTVQNWRNPLEIYKLAALCVAQRETGRYSALEIQAEKLRGEGARCILLNVNPMPLSSTSIRERIGKAEDVSVMLDPRVLRYIKENRLYGT